MTEESIIDLFLAGIGPGLLLSALFVVFAMVYAYYSGDYQPSAKASWDERRRNTLRALPTLALAVLIMAGIYGGAFTPTEAAGVGFVAALLLTTLVLRSLDWSGLKQAVMDAMQTTVTIFLILAGAKVFGKAITLYRIPQDISTFISATIDQAGLFILMVCVVLLVMGLVLEALSMLLIMMPVLYPSLSVLGIDPVWFGILFVVMIECALITPPVGLNLYVIQAVGKAPMGEVASGVWPFILIMLSTVVLIYVMPDIALYIPFRL